MKRFEFRLERVLRYREKREKIAELRQKQAVAALKLVEDEINALQDHLRQTSSALERQLGGTASLSTWVASYAQAGRISKALEAAEGRAEQARQAVLEANARRRQAATEVEVIRSYRARQWHAHRVVQNRHEQERSDELALRSWMNDDSEGEVS